MRIKWDNLGKGLEAIADAKMTSDAEKLLNRQQQTTLTEQGGLQNNPNLIYDEDTGQYLKPYTSTADERQSRTVDNARPDGLDDGQYQRPTYTARSKLGDAEYDTPLSQQDVRKQNRQAAMDYWASKGPAGKEGLKVLSDEETAESHRVTAGLQQKHLTNTLAKEDAQTAADKEVAGLLDRANLHPSDSPEHQRYLEQAAQKVTAAYGAVKGQEYLASQFKLSEARRAAEVSKREDGMIVASRSPESAVDWYNKQYKNGETAKLIDGPNGVKQIVHVGADGETKDVILAYRDWNKEGRPAIIQGIPKYAAEAYKLDKQHEYKLEEIKAQGKEHMRYAAALRADKEVKMTDDQKERLAEASKAIQKASDPKAPDEAAYKAAVHQFNGIVREIGIANKNFGVLAEPKSGGGGIPPTLLKDFFDKKAALADEFSQIKNPTKDQVAQYEARVRALHETYGAVGGRLQGEGGKDRPIPAPPQLAAAPATSEGGLSGAPAGGFYQGSPELAPLSVPVRDFSQDVSALHGLMPSERIRRQREANLPR